MESEKLDAIRELRESIPAEQRELIATVLSEEEMSILGTILSSTYDEKVAERALGRFRDVLEKNPLKAVKLWNKLDERQRGLIGELLKQGSTKST